MYEDSTWRANGGLRDGCLAQLRNMMEFKRPVWKVMSCPQIGGQVNFLKKKYITITDMISHGGFNWSENQLMIAGDKSFYKELVKIHKEAKELYCEQFLHYYLLEEIYGTDSTAGANVADSDTDKGQTKQEDVNEEDLDADLKVCANGDVLMDFNANLGVTKKTKVSVPDQLDRPRSGKRKFRENSPKAPNCGAQVGSSISMEEMSEKYGRNMASCAASTRFKIDGLGLKVDSLVLRIDGVVNALYQAREVPDLQAKIVNELNKLEGLYDTQVFPVVNILAPKDDFPRVILPWLKR